MQITLLSFGFKHGLPVDVDMVIDCRFLPNPHWVDELRPLTGQDQPVRDYVFAQPATGSSSSGSTICSTCCCRPMPPKGKAYLSIAFGCTGGRHRSVAIAEEVASRLRRDRAQATRRPPGHGEDMSRCDPPAGRRVVAIGGGHGLAATLRAVRRYAADITAVVSVADDGGSSGRLREGLSMPAPGDLRRCLNALAEPDSALGAALEYRFVPGDLAGHALGNLLIAGLADPSGASSPRSTRSVGWSAPSVGSCRPPPSRSRWSPTRVGVDAVEGQVAVQNTAGIHRLAVRPASPITAARGRGGHRGGRSGRDRARFAVHQRARRDDRACRAVRAAIAATAARRCTSATSGRSTPRPTASPRPTTCRRSPRTASRST